MTGEPGGEVAVQDSIVGKQPEGVSIRWRHAKFAVYVIARKMHTAGSSPAASPHPGRRRKDWRAQRTQSWHRCRAGETSTAGRPTGRRTEPSAMVSAAQGEIAERQPPCRHWQMALRSAWCFYGLPWRELASFARWQPTTCPAGTSG